ncbi:MAG TPA: ABC transporter permease, partial [Cyclobacteriaceae bacterium]
MLKNYFKSAYRNFVRHKSFTFLNVSGLALGLSASLMIIQYVKYERSFDSFHSNAENIYRIQYNNYQNGSLSYECAAAVPAVGPEMKNNFPEIIRFTRLYPVSGVITYNSPELGIISFKEDKMQIADQRVFQIFDFELAEGNPETCLEGPNKAVISQSAAQKYFQDEDPIGKTIKWGSEREYEITGIMEDVPDNSHIKFNILFSFQTLNNETENASEESWGWYDFNTYVQVQEGVEIKELQAKWDKHLQEVRGEAWEHNNFKQEFLFQPLLNIHLYSNLLQESQPQEQGDGQAVYFLGIVAFFILI